MENIEVGEWIINQNRLVIGQIIGINEERQEATIKVKRLELLIGFWNIRKHSKNIMELIEDTDILQIEISEEWVEKEQTKAFIVVGQTYTIMEIQKALDDGMYKIKQILTHEQYEQNCYKVSNDRTQ